MRKEVDEVNEAIFAEMTYHAAYEPQRAIRTRRWKYVRRFGERELPVLANIDDGPTKDLFIAEGWGERPVPRESLYDLLFDPAEAHNLADEPSHLGVLAELQGRLEAWMRDTDDPLLDGDVDPPPGAVVNEPDALSASDPHGVLR
jgi:N-sulfoglucosamine sulfohydrolase